MRRSKAASMLAGGIVGALAAVGLTALVGLVQWADSAVYPWENWRWAALMGVVGGIGGAIVGSMLAGSPPAAADPQPPGP